MVNAQGSLKVTANGEEYTLHFGLSVLADLQAKYGKNILGELEAPAGDDGSWQPDLAIFVDVFLYSLQRFHADVANKYLVDDIASQNDDVFNKLMKASNPDPSTEAKAGNAKSRGKAA
jgi:hypothetical protein